MGTKLTHPKHWAAKRKKHSPYALDRQDLHTPEQRRLEAEANRILRQGRRQAK